MSLFWLRVAVGLYGVTMMYALIALLRRREILSRATLPIAGVAATLHLVSLVEAFVSGGMAARPLHQSESLLAFLMMLLLIGFPFMAIGLIAGSIIAQARYGASYFQDPKIILSLLMWGVYSLMLFTRWNSGWRGRRAALLSAFAFAAALSVWAANYFSG